MQLPEHKLLQACELYLLHVKKAGGDEFVSILLDCCVSKLLNGQIDILV